MKKIILTLLALTLPIVTSRAFIVLSETFSYPDGTLTAVSGGTWVAHSGAGSGAQQVVGGQLRVAFNSAEDVNRLFDSSAVFDTTNNPSVNHLYSSFTINLTNAPTSGTANIYFSHFKDSGTFNFRARIFAITNGAAAGKYRIGIGATNSAPTTVGFVAFPQDLDLNTTYTVVSRINVTNGQSTLWIDPATEASTSVTNDPPDPGTTISLAAYAFRQNGSGGAVVFVDSLKIGTLFNDVAGANTAPLVSPIPNQNTPRNAAIGPIAFTVEDAETPAASLIVSNGSSNASLVPNGNIVLGGSGTNRNLTITPAAGQQGSTTISNFVSDGVNTTVSTFVLTVGAPYISPIANQITVSNTPTPAIAFTIGDAEGDSLTLSSNSSNPTLITSIVFGGSGSNRTVTLTPEPNQTGVATITLTADDGTTTFSRSFKLTVTPLLGIVLADTFSYTTFTLSNALYGATDSPWAHASGAIFYEVQVLGGAAELTFQQSEDVAASLTNGPFASTNGVVLYSGFTVRFNVLPTASGNYFAHFKDSNPGTTFRGKVFAATANAAPGQLRIGIANQGNAPSVEYPMDLNLGSTYNVVTKYNTGTGETWLWVNPASEGSPNVAAVDALQTSSIGSYGLREDTGIGVVDIDNLVISTSFADVLTAVAPGPTTLTNDVFGTDRVLSWAGSQFALQCAPAVTGVYTNIPGVTSPHTNAIADGQKFFRLKY